MSTLSVASINLSLTFFGFDLIFWVKFGPRHNLVDATTFWGFQIMSILCNERPKEIEVREILIRNPY